MNTNKQHPVNPAKWQLELVQICQYLDTIHKVVNDQQNYLLDQWFTQQPLKQFTESWPQYRDWMLGLDTDGIITQHEKVVMYLNPLVTAITHVEKDLTKDSKNRKSVGKAVSGVNQCWDDCKHELQGMHDHHARDKQPRDQHPRDHHTRDHHTRDQHPRDHHPRDHHAPDQRHAVHSHSEEARQAVYDTRPTRHETQGYYEQRRHDPERDGSVNKAGLAASVAGTRYSVDEVRHMMTSLPAGDLQQLKDGLVNNIGQELAKQHAADEEEKHILKKEIKRLKEENTALLKNMSEMMSTRMSADERNMENISDPCRPSVVCDQYALFCSQQWLNAKVHLDQTALPTDDVKCKLLCDILVHASSLAMDEVCGANDNIKMILMSVQNGHTTEQQKTRHTDKSRTVKATDEITIAGDLRVAISKFYKTRLDRKSRDDIKQNVKKVIFNKIDQKIWENPHMQRYVDDGITLAWKMAIQLPMMRMSIDQDNQYNPGRHELAMDSADPRHARKIEYYVHPVVFHEAKVVVKGKVLLR